MVGVDNIQISGGNITATTDFVVGEDNHVDGCAAGIGRGEKRILMEELFRFQLQITPK